MKKGILFSLFTILLLLLASCETTPYALLEFTGGSTGSISAGGSVQVKLIVGDQNSNDITYKWSSGINGDSYEDTKTGIHTITYSSEGTYTLKAYAFDGTAYTNIQSLTVTVGSGGGTNPGGGNGIYHLHTDIKATTFWVGEVGSDDNHNISNVPSAWDNSWGDDFGIEDHPTWLPRDAEHFPDHSSYQYKENPFYFALPYNDYGDLVFDGDNKQSANANSSSDYFKEFNSDYGRDIVRTTKMGNYYGEWRKSTVTSIPWKDSQGWAGQSMVKGRWARIRYNGGSWVYAQWLDAGPYHYDDVDYVFGTSRPRNDNGTLGESPYAGIDLSPSVMLSMGVKMNDWGTTLDGGIDWEFVDYNDVPSGPWKRVVSDSYTNW